MDRDPIPTYDVDRRRGRFIKVISAMMMCGGVVIGIWGTGDHSSRVAGVGGFIALAGFLGFVVGRFFD